jgi:hypothetical protein
MTPARAALAGSLWRSILPRDLQIEMDLKIASFSGKPHELCELLAPALPAAGQSFARFAKR